MPTIDYDGISDTYRYEIEKAEKAVVDVLLSAMRDGEIVTCSLHWKWAICQTCRGGGGTSRHFGVISTEMLNDWDDEFADDYRRGAFDQACYRCDGTGKVQELDLDQLPDDVVVYRDEYLGRCAKSAAERVAEMRAGC